MFFLDKVLTWPSVRCPCGFMQVLSNEALNSIISLWEKQNINNNISFSGDNVRENHANFYIRLSECFCCTDDRLNIVVTIKKIHD